MAMAIPSLMATMNQTLKVTTILLQTLSLTKMLIYLVMQRLIQKETMTSRQKVSWKVSLRRMQTSLSWCLR